MSDVYPVIMKFPSRLAFLNHVIACIFNGFLTITTVVLNCCIVVTFSCSPRLRRNVSLFLVMLLSFADIGVGLIANTIFVVELANQIAGNIDCFLHLVGNRSSIVLTNLSLLTVTAINIERYFGVVHPFLHRTKVTTGKLLTFVILSWSTCGVVLGVSFFAHRPLTIFGAVVKLAFVAFTVFVYGKIALIVFSAKKQTNSFSRASILKSYSEESTETDSAPSSIEKRKGKLHFLAELKLAKSCFYIVICYVVCYSPAAVMLGAMRESFQGYDRILAVIWCTTLAMLNSTLNSVIFFWRSRQMRKEMMHAFKIKQPRRRNDEKSPNKLS